MRETGKPNLCTVMNPPERVLDSCYGKVSFLNWCRLECFRMNRLGGKSRVVMSATSNTVGICRGGVGSFRVVPDTWVPGTPLYAPARGGDINKA